MGKTSSAVKDRYNAKAYDEVKLRLPKGRKEALRAHAQRFDEGSVNHFLQRAIETRMLHDLEPAEPTEATEAVQARLAAGKTCTIVGGVNGAGKSSFTAALRVATGDTSVLVDVDRIASTAGVGSVAGSRVADERVSECLRRGISFIQETTLSVGRTQSLLRQARELGYHVRLYYVGLDSAEECRRRVANRMARGGYSLAQDDMHLRQAGRWEALFGILPHCDEASFLDNDNGFVEVAAYRDGVLTLRPSPRPRWVLEFSEYFDRHLREGA